MLLVTFIFIKTMSHDLLVQVAYLDFKRIVASLWSDFRLWKKR